MFNKFILKIFQQEPKSQFQISLIWALISIIYFGIIWFVVNDTSLVKGTNSIISYRDFEDIAIPPYILLWCISGFYLILSLINKYFSKKIIQKIEFDRLSEKKKEKDLGIISDDEYQNLLNDYKLKYPLS